jgi:hypothetical protein
MCFQHPRWKSADHSASCPECGEALSFPLDKPPVSINDWPVVAAVNRGFYGAVYKVAHPRLPNRFFAFKVTPRAVYDLPAPNDKLAGGYGDRKQFDDEWELHSQLSEVEDPRVARLLDRGEEAVDFGGVVVPCYWMQMEYVEGDSLDDLVANGPESPRDVAQIAIDLLDLVAQLQQQGVNHNDLHGQNAVLVKLKPQTSRRNALHPGVVVKVFDLGSASTVDKSGGNRLGDLEWVAQHMYQLVESYESKNPSMDARDQRLCSQLRRLAELYFPGDRVRPPDPSDLQHGIRTAWLFADRPTRQPVVLDSIRQHFNATTLPSSFAKELLYDPDREWERRLISSSGPVLLSGMRGCGKTMLLRGLEWSARTHRGDNEDQSEVLARVGQDKFLGLFVSCASLLRTPRATSVDAPVARLLLAFAREAVRAVAICDLDEIGKVRTHALAPFADFIQSNVPWFEPPADKTDYVAVERALDVALQRNVTADEGAVQPQALLAFERFVELTRPLVDLWANRTIFFLLDDASTRVLPKEDVKTILTAIRQKSPLFGFKISTEDQTLLTVPFEEEANAQTAREGRDYEYFDLGREVLGNLAGRKGVEFLRGILSRRVQIVTRLPEYLGAPEEVLGQQDLATLAEALRSTGAKEPVYWGLQALAAVCAGDIGAVLQLYDDMLDRAGSGTVTQKIQHDILTEAGNKKLMGLAGRDPWLYQHAVAFSQASSRELLQGTRARQYASVYLTIDPTRMDKVFDRIVQLVDGGVYVFLGAVPRMKHLGMADEANIQFKLGFRKTYGLIYRIPLSMRDRFEPAMDDTTEWVLEPSAAGLTAIQEPDETGHEQDGEDLFIAAEEENPGELKVPSPPAAAKSGRYVLPARPRSSDLQLQMLFGGSASTEDLPDLALLYRASCRSLDLAAAPFAWQEAAVVAAAGFEDRTLGAWDALSVHLRQGPPRQVQLVTYPDRGELDGILERVEGFGGGAPVLVSTETPAHPAETVEAILSAVPVGAPLVIDTTSLTKPFIYMLVREGLRNNDRIWVLHTAARDYHPLDKELERPVALLESFDYLEGFKGLSDAVLGERGPFEPVAVGSQERDPSLPSTLVAFVALKKERLDSILHAVPFENLVTIAGIHSSGPDSLRSRAMRFLGEAMVADRGGTLQRLSTVDPQAVYSALADAHAEGSLEGMSNFEISLTGSKLQCVGVGMFAAVAQPAAVYYSRPQEHRKEHFTDGTGATRLFQLERHLRAGSAPA